MSIVWMSLVVYTSQQQPMWARPQTDGPMVTLVGPCKSVSLLVWQLMESFIQTSGPFAALDKVAG